MNLPRPLPPSARAARAGRARGLGGVLRALLLAAATVGLLAPATAAAPAQQQEATVTVGADVVGWNQEVLVTGTGWAPGAAVEVSLLPDTIVLSTATAAGDGTFRTTIVIPEVASSTNYLIAATGQGANGVFQFVADQVTIKGPSPVVTVDAAVLEWEQTTIVRGDLWLPGTTVQLTLMPANVPLGEAAVGPDRRFEVAVHIPRDLASSQDYQVVATGAGADSQFAFAGAPVTVVGPRPVIEVTKVDGTPNAVEVSGQLWLKGTTAVVTLLPSSERLADAVVADDGTFRVRVTLPEAAPALGGRGALAVTGQGADHLFAFLAAEVELVTADATPPVRIEAPPARTTGLPTGNTSPGLETRPLGVPFDRILESLRGVHDEPDEETAADVALALFLLLLTVVGGWLVYHGLRSDLGEALERGWHRVRRLPPGA